MNVALSRLDLDDLDDLTTVLAELKLTREDAPLVWLAEKLINQIRSGGSPTGIAALSAQLVIVLKELGATPTARGGNSSPSGVLDSFRKK